MKPNVRLNSVVVTLGLTMILVCIDMGIYYKTGGSLLLDFSQKLKGYAYNKQSSLQIESKVEKTLNQINQKLTDIEAKIDTNQKHNNNFNNMKIVKLANMSENPKVNGIIETIIERKMHILKLPPSTSKNLNKLSSSSIITKGTENATISHGKLLGEMQPVDIKYPSLTSSPSGNPLVVLRRFKTKQDQEKFRNQVFKYGYKPEFETAISKEILSLNDIINHSASHPNKSQFRNNNTVSNIHYPVQNIPKTNEIKQSLKHTDKVHNPDYKFEMNTNEEFNRLVNNVQNHNVNANQSKKDKHKKIRIKKAVQQVNKLNLENQLLRQQQLQYIAERNLRNSELEVLKQLKKQNKEIAEYNNNLINISHKLIHEIENATKKLEKLNSSPTNNKFDFLDSFTISTDKSANTQQSKKNKKNINKEQTTKIGSDSTKVVKTQTNGSTQDTLKILNQIEKTKNEINEIIGKEKNSTAK